MRPWEDEPDVAGNVAGNIAGNVAGNIAGNVAGNIAGNVTGNVAGTAGSDVTSGYVIRRDGGIDVVEGFVPFYLMNFGPNNSHLTDAELITRYNTINPELCTMYPDGCRVNTQAVFAYLNRGPSTLDPAPQHCYRTPEDCTFVSTSTANVSEILGAMNDLVDMVYDPVYWPKILAKFIQDGANVNHPQFGLNEDGFLTVYDTDSPVGTSVRVGLEMPLPPAVVSLAISDKIKGKPRTYYVDFKLIEETDGVVTANYMPVINANG
jgi:hypothetical protein